MSNRRAVLLLSGGLDSATMLAIARHEKYECHTLSFSYGQKHRAELSAAAQIAKSFNVESHRQVDLPTAAFSGSALTDSNIDVPSDGGDGIPVTYVPARNTIFLSLALGCAEVLQAAHIFVGVNAIDYSGYPDCRPVFISAFQSLANVATKQAVEGAPVKIHAPLIAMSKAEIIRVGTKLNVDYALTISCYKADDHGRACGDCDSCRLRQEGFSAVGVNDPTRYR